MPAKQPGSHAAAEAVPQHAQSEAGVVSLYIGTYTDGASKGILHARFDTRSGALSRPELAVETINPTFLAIHPHAPFLYAVNETGEWRGRPGGSVGAYAVRAPGDLALLNEVSSVGAGPCHIVPDSGGRSAIVANYVGGSLASFRIADDGRLSDAVSFFQYTGGGPDRERQEGPHAHSCTLSRDDRFAIACDLGTDLLHVYSLAAHSAELTQHAPHTVRCVPGGGPRHFTFDPAGNLAFLLNEMGNSITSFAWDPASGQLRERETVPTLPADFYGESIAAEVLVHPSNRCLYASNRGHDSIAVFRIAADGALTLIDCTPAGGRTPRNFNFDPSGRWLLAANQDSGNIAVFEIQVDGSLRATGAGASCGAPVCLRFMC